MNPASGRLAACRRIRCGSSWSRSPVGSTSSAMSSTISRGKPCPAGAARGLGVCASRTPSAVGLPRKPGHSDDGCCWRQPRLTVDVWTSRGLTRFAVVFIIDLSTRRINIAGIAPEPDAAWMSQMSPTSRNLGVASRHVHTRQQRDRAAPRQSGRGAFGHRPNRVGGCRRGECERPGGRMRSLKHQWLFSTRWTASRPSWSRSNVNEHNRVLPHSAFRGQTPDEMYFGTGDTVPADLTSRAAAARRTRVESQPIGVVRDMPVSRRGAA